MDSQSTAMALGFQALAASRALEAGASLKEVVALAEKAHKKAAGFYFRG